MIIAIAGQAGSGKSSVATALAKRLGYKHYSIGDLRRHAAEKRGMTLAEYNKLGETDPSTDKEADAFAEKLGKEEDNFVIDGRMIFHFIPHSVKVFLHADLNERAKRVYQDERKAEHFHNLDDVKQALEEREKSDRTRYKKYYTLDSFNKEHHDLVIDTSDLNVDEVVSRIMDFLKTP